MQAIEDKIEDSTSPEPLIFQLYFKTLSSRVGKYLILIFWFSILVLGVLYGRDLLNLTQFVFHAPKGTDGHKADREFKKEFSTVSKEGTILVYFDCSNCSSTNPITSPSVHLKNMSYTLNSSVFDYGAKHDHMVKSYQDYYMALAFDPTASDYTQFVAFAHKIYISGKGTSMLGILKYDNTKGSTKISDFVSWLKDECKTITNQHKRVVVITITGEQPLVEDMNAESRTDVEKKDMITIPVALCVLGVIVRSWRLMFIPIFCVFASLCCSFSIMTPIATSLMEINPFAPSIMVSVTIAMSIDYSLFLLTRFREEIEKNRHQRMNNNPNAPKKYEVVLECVRQMTRWSGKVVALSGFILSITYFALVFYPMTMLQSVGLGASVAIICTIVVNLTLTPALLLSFPNFFSTFGFTCRCREKEGNQERFLQVQESDEVMIERDENIITKSRIIPNNPGNEGTLEEFSDIGIEADNDDDDSHMLNDDQISLCDRCWLRIGKITTTTIFSILIIFAVYGAISPVGWRVVELQKQLDDTLIFPRDSDYLSTYKQVENDFSAGSLAPFYILIPSGSADNNSVFNSHYIDVTGRIMADFYHNLTHLHYNVTIFGVSDYNNYNLNYSDYLLYRNESIYRYETKDCVNDDKTSSYFTMVTDFDPYNAIAIDFVSNTRNALNNLCNEAGYNCYLTGGSVDEVDCVNQIFSTFPMVLGIIVAVIFSLMGFFFVSVFVPVRLFLTIAVPMTLVYGLSILTYQKGLLSSLNWRAVGNTDGLYWLIPVMTVTILCGLALDYDIFLFARIYEYRTVAGLPTRKAIIYGVYNTGSIITAAGCIMAIAFCGLLFSQITSLNQVGFILVVAVLVDTFVIRVLLVPSVLSLAGEINWWPGSLLCPGKGQRSIRLESNVVGNDYNKPISDDIM